MGDHTIPYHISDWLPTSAKEVKALGWESIDVILFSGDAYIDHPSFHPFSPGFLPDRKKSKFKWKGNTVSKSIVNAMSLYSAKICSNLMPIKKQNNNLIWKTIDGDDYLLVENLKENK